MTKTRYSGTVKTFATFRVAGDRLDPKEVSKILKVRPTTAYAKGEHYSGGPRSPDLIGRTGVWFLSTDHIVPGNALGKHVGALIRTLVPNWDDPRPFAELADLIKRQKLEAHVTLFWHGRPGAIKPQVPPVVASFFETLPADLEIDFDADEDSGHRRVA